MKDRSVPASSMLFEGTSKEEEDPRVMTIMMETINLPKEETLPIKSLMVTCRIMSPSLQPSKSELQDPYPESLMGTESKPRPSSPNF
jgi:hypothetical protein